MAKRKRFTVHYSVNEDTSHLRAKESSLPFNDEYYGDASTIKAAKGYISRIKRLYPHQEPHNFRIYDCWAEVDDIFKDACVYQQD